MLKALPSGAMLVVMRLSCSEMAIYATLSTKHHSLSSATTPLPKYVQVRNCICADLFLALFISCSCLNSWIQIQHERNELEEYEKTGKLHLL